MSNLYNNYLEGLIPGISALRDSMQTFSSIKTSAMLNPTIIALSNMPGVRDMKAQQAMLKSMTSAYSAWNSLRIDSLPINSVLNEAKIALSTVSFCDMDAVRNALVSAYALLQESTYAPDSVDEAGFSEEEQAEVKEMVAEILNDSPHNWEYGFAKMIETAKTKHPIWMAIILFVLGTLASYLIEDIFDTIKNTVIREEPNTSAAVVINIQAEQVVLVVNDVPYYYEVEYVDETTGETYTGWISKRSVRARTEDIS